MHDAVLMRDFEGKGDLLRDSQGVARWHRSRRDPIGERLSRNELEHERLHTRLP